MVYNERGKPLGEEERTNKLYRHRDRNRTQVVEDECSGHSANTAPIDAPTLVSSLLPLTSKVSLLYGQLTRKTQMQRKTTKQWFIEENQQITDLYPYCLRHSNKCLICLSQCIHFEGALGVVVIHFNIHHCLTPGMAH